MNQELLIMVENELLSEAKRLVPISYDNNKYTFCKIGKTLYKEINSIYKNFYVDIELRLIGLCYMKHRGRNYKLKKINIKNRVANNYQYIRLKKRIEKIDLCNLTKHITKDILENIEKYKNKTLFEIIPLLCSKYINGHYDSVDYLAIIMLIENELKKCKKYLRTTKLDSLQTIN